MSDHVHLAKRERLATILFERWDEVENYTVARRIADLVLERIEHERDQVA